MKVQKILQKARNQPANVRFGDMRKLVEAYGFNLDRINGSHHVFVHPSIPELLNLQDEGGKAKAYQVRQFIKLVDKYNLKSGADNGD